MRVTLASGLRGSIRRRGVLVAAALVVAAACGGGSAATDAGTTVTVTSTEKAIQLDRASAPAGMVTFKVVNTDKNVHSLVLLKTDLPHDKIPVDPKDPSRPDKSGELKETGEVQGGQTKEFKVKLEAGNYVLVCNEPAHYAVGMHVPFKVQ
ncbi:MAG TPA: cupredoxin domain-containing protein [Candidatus Limnocylindria bacterium]|nr:cupredoxin domain-containing protein [Candidatus Limnocylindria bacterium]